MGDECVNEYILRENRIICYALNKCIFSIFRSYQMIINVKATIKNCDGVVLKIYSNHSPQQPQEGLNCKSLAYKVVT